MPLSHLCWFSFPLLTLIYVLLRCITRLRLRVVYYRRCSCRCVSDRVICYRDCECHEELLPCYNRLNTLVSGGSRGAPYACPPKGPNSFILKSVKSVMKSTVKSVMKSAVKSTTKSIMKSTVKSIMKSAVKSTMKSVMKSALKSALKQKTTCREP